MLLRLLPLCLALGALPAQAARPLTTVTDPAQAAQFHVMAGELAAQRQQPLEAARQFLKALDYTDDPALAQRATVLASAANDDALTAQAGRRWLALDPASLDAREVLLRISLRRGLAAEVREQAEVIVRDHAGGEDEGFRHVALILSQERSGASLAIEVMRGLRQTHAGSVGAAYALGILAQRFGRYEDAERAAQQALELDGDSAEARLLLLGAQVRLGQLKAAEETLAALIAAGGNEKDLRLGYVRLLTDARQREAAAAQLRLILDAAPDDADARYALGLLALDARDLDGAEEWLAPLADSPTHAVNAAFFLGGIAQLRRQYADAVSWYEKVTEGDKALEGLLRRAALLTRLERTDEARDIYTSLREQAPMLGTRVDTEEAGALLEAGRPADALAVLERALKKSTGDTELLYARSLVFERQGQVKPAEADLRRLLKVNARDARALNALGYLLASRTSRLKEARQLIAQALQLEPEDAAILDSYGWVQFRLGKPREALPSLEKSWDKLKDPEVAAHLGEVLWTLGDKERAGTIWDAALADDPEHRVLKDTVRRLRR